MLRYKNNPKSYSVAAKAKRGRKLVEYRAKGRQKYYDNKPVYLAYAKKWKTERRLNQPWIPTIESTKQRAKKKNIPFELTFEWGANRWTGHCELTGLPFSIGHRGKPGAGFFSPSIDKIDATKGYTQTNSRFVLHCVNIFKFTGSDADMYQVAEALLKHRDTIRIARTG